MSAKRRMKKMKRIRRVAGKPQSTEKPQLSAKPAVIAGETFSPIPSWVKSDADVEQYRLALQNDYRKQIRKSPMWNRWVSDYGLEKAESMLLECNVQTNVVNHAYDAH